MKKIFLSFVLCIATVFGQISFISAEAYDQSGITGVKKLSMDELRTLYNEIEEQSTNLFSKTPVTVGKYDKGSLSEEAVKRAESYLNFFRINAGLNEITFPSDLNAIAQSGALLLAINGNSEQPEGMSASDYEQGSYALKHSNRFSGPSDEASVLDLLIKNQIDSNANSYLSMVHPRRYLLKPDTTTLGIGSAQNSDEVYYSNILIHGNEVTENDKEASYNFISWPASGNMLSETFEPNVPWSVSLNPDEYSTPDITNVTVTLTRLSDNKKWIFDKSDNIDTPTTSNEYFSIDTEKTRPGYCIIFRPIASEIGNSYDGEYTVQISGLIDADGTSKQLLYKVNFQPYSRTYDVTVEGYSGIYDGREHTINISGEKPGSTILYRTNKTEEWDDNKPTRTNAGITTVYCQITNPNYDTIEKEATIDIKKHPINQQ